MVTGTPGHISRRDDAALTTFWAREWGFPFRCFWSWSAEQRTSAAAGMTSRSVDGGALPIPGKPMSNGSLPYLPIWFGLIANIAIYALALAGLRTSFVWCRGTLRRRRGLCPHCRYDLRATPPDAPCPECGRGPPTQKNL